MSSARAATKGPRPFSSVRSACMIHNGRHRFPPSVDWTMSQRKLSWRMSEKVYRMRRVTPSGPGRSAKISARWWSKAPVRVKNPGSGRISDGQLRTRCHRSSSGS